MLELRNISYEVGDDNESREILKNVSLTIEDHFVAITGPNIRADYFGWGRDYRVKYYGAGTLWY